MIDFDIYKKIDNKWYNTKQSLLEKKDYIGAIKITEQYLEKLNGDYESKYSGKLAYMFLDSLINISHVIKDYDYALEKCQDLQKINLAEINRPDDGDTEFYLGATYYELGDLDKAKEYLLIAKKKSGGRCMELLGTNKYSLFLKSVEPSKEQIKMQKAFDKLSKLFKDEEMTEDIDLFIKNMVKSGFFSEEEMLVGLRNFVEYNYEDYFSKLKSKQLPSILSLYNEIYSNKKEPVNFRKLDAAFNQLTQNGFVAKHAIGNTDDEGFEECKDEAIERMDKGEDMVGCCFYTLQALFDMFENESNQLLLSYGNFHDTPDAVEVGNCICTQLKEAGFEVIWNKDVNTKIAVCIEWDNKYLESE